MTPLCFPGETINVERGKGMVHRRHRAAAHCRRPGPRRAPDEHIANGMYGLILVEPEEGLPRVDCEFYVMQGEIYTDAPYGQHGSAEFSVEKLLNERPEYFVFNGSVGALAKLHPLQAKVGDTVRILQPEFHVVLPC